MADSIGNISGYGNYGVGGYLPNKQNNDEVEQENQNTTVQNNEETQVDPNKVMEFLNYHNYFVNLNPANNVEGTEKVELDPATQERIEGFMEKFEMIYGIVVDEFGEELAPQVMDIIMDRLMGMFSY